MAPASSCPAVAPVCAYVYSSPCMQAAAVSCTLQYEHRLARNSQAKSQVRPDVFESCLLDRNLKSARLSLGLPDTNVTYAYIALQLVVTKE